MDFISLSEAIHNMAEGITRDAGDEDRYSDAAYAKATRYSEVASILHQSLHNNEKTGPRWLEISKTTNKPLYNEGVSVEGMGILLHMAGWHGRLKDEHLRYLDDCESAEKAGIDASLIHPSINTSGGLYTMKGYSRPREIGFDRAELAAFLTVYKVPHSLGTPIQHTVIDATALLSKPVAGGYDEQGETANEKSWQVSKPKRMDTLARMIYDVLKTKQNANELRVPTARDVMEGIKAAASPDFVELLSDELKCLDSNGSVITVSMDAIRRRIGRMTKAKVDDNRTLKGR